MYNIDLQVDVAIIGAGTAGANALKEIRHAGKSFVLIDHGPLGTTCARVGCMPSKAALHAGAAWQGQASHRLAGNEESAHLTPSSLWQAARGARDMLAANAADRTIAATGNNLTMGTARFVSSNTIEIDEQRVKAKAFVIATGSHPALPGFPGEVKDRVLTTDTLFDMSVLPRSVGILGLGAIGLEIGLALSRLGVRVVAGDIQEVPAGIEDPEIAAHAASYFADSPNLTLWLGKRPLIRRSANGVSLTNGDDTEEVEWLLAALGRRPSVTGLQLEAAGLTLDASGMPSIDSHTMRAGQSALYFAGDVSADRSLLHKAADEGAIAGWNAAHHGSPARFRRRTPLSIVFSDPDLATVGMRFNQLNLEQTVIGTASGKGNGRSRIMGAEHNLVRVYADRRSGKLLGAGIFAVRGEHIAHLLAWAIQRGETAEALLEMPFYHPTIEEMVQFALSDIVRQRGAANAGPTGIQFLAAADKTN